MARARLSHSIQDLQRYEEWPFIQEGILRNLIAAPLPSVDQQLSNLIRWMMEVVQDDYLAPIDVPDFDRLAAIIGAKDGDRVGNLLKYADEQGLVAWVHQTCIALTVEGSRSMKQLMTDSFTFINRLGEVVKSNIKGRVTGTTLITFDSTLPVTPGDRFLRSLPSGLEEEFVVEDPGYQGKLPGMEAHFQSRVRRSDSPPADRGTIINNIHGPNARVNINSTDNSSNVNNQDQRTQVYNGLRERLEAIPADVSTIEAIRDSIDRMEASHGSPSFIQRYSEFMAAAANHVAVFAPLLPALAAFLPGVS